MILSLHKGRPSMIGVDLEKRGEGLEGYAARDAEGTVVLLSRLQVNTLADQRDRT